MTTRAPFIRTPRFLGDFEIVGDKSWGSNQDILFQRKNPHFFRIPQNFGNRIVALFLSHDFIKWSENFKRRVHRDGWNHCASMIRSRLVTLRYQTCSRCLSLTCFHSRSRVSMPWVTQVESVKKCDKFRQAAQCCPFRSDHRGAVLPGTSSYGYISLI